MINETQRKYLRTRLDAIHQQKISEIRAAATVPSPWSTTSKTEYVRKLLADAGVNLDFGKGGVDYIITDLDQQYKEAVAIKSAQASDRCKSLKGLYNRVMDDIILGDDADVLRTAIDSLNNFSVTGATN